MDHIVYLDFRAKELDNLRNGIKTMLIRGAMGRKFPYGKLQTDERLYFIENKGDGFIKATALIANVVNTEQLSKDASMKLIENHQSELCLDKGLINRFGGKRYLVLISIKEFRDIDTFKIDRSAYANMDDWLPVGDINTVKIQP